VPPDVKDRIGLRLRTTVSAHSDRFKRSGHPFNGAGAFRGLFAYSGAATIENLTIYDAVAQGGGGGEGIGGGGGAGLGHSWLRKSGLEHLSPVGSGSFPKAQCDWNRIKADRSPP